MNARDVVDSLRLRYPDSEYLTILEAPEDAARQGRKIDMLAIALWQSRGYERHGIEVKVSVNDWRRELARAEKADYWWRHSHRFFVAVPAEIAPTVRDELPEGWGLLACEPGAKPRVVVSVPCRQPQAFSEQTLIGIMRASADSGASALYRAEQKGYERGVATEKAKAAEHGVPVADQQLQVDHRNLVALVDDFTKFAGVDIRRLSRWNELPNFARALHITGAIQSGAFTLDQMTRSAARLEEAAEVLRQIDRAFSEPLLLEDVA